MQTKKCLAAVILSFLSLILLYSCEEKKGKKLKKKDKQEKAGTSGVTQEVNDTDSSACNDMIWKYVYDPGRLEIKDKCMTVTGVIEETSANDDGDQHMLLKLDKGQENLLAKMNIKKKNGDLVIEAVCMNTITNPKVGGACTGYVNHIKLPKIGDHVKVTGSYVIDSHNGWAEIHPISKMEVQ